MERWRTRFAADDPARVQRLRGRDGLARFLSPLRATAAAPAGFDALVQVTRVGAVSVTNCLATACTVSHPGSRTTRVTADDELSLLVFSSTGTVSAGTPATPTPFRAGGLIVLSSVLPARISLDTPHEGIRVSIPLTALSGELHRSLDELHPIASDTALVRATTMFVRRFAESAASRLSPAGTDAAAVKAVIGLVTSVAAQQLHQITNPDDTARTVRERTRKLIESGFRDPEFDTDSVSRGLHLSRRQMYRHFAATGESLADMIAARRLEEARSLLIALPDMRLADVAGAAGFASASTMRNRFRGEFGVTPAEFRARSPIRLRRRNFRGPGEVDDLSGAADG